MARQPTNEMTKACGEVATHDHQRGIQRYSARGSFYQDLSNLTTNVSGRPGLSRNDYDKFRPDEALPQTIYEEMVQSNKAYKRVGLIRNTIDLMADFGCQGIRIVHPNSRIEKFYQNWWNRIDGPERSERFLNYLYRLGTVPVRRMIGRITVKQADTLYKGLAANEVDFETLQVNQKNLPLKYVFLNPLTIVVVGGELASFVGKPIYGIRIPYHLAMLIKSPQTDEEKMFVSKLPPEIKAAAKNDKVVPIPSEKLEVFFYRKDDWEGMASPMISGILDDIGVLEKLKLADIAALDGAISNIRIFKLGSLEHKIPPLKAAAAKLGEILESHVGGGTMDLVWGPDIELVESKTNVHEFLGEEKYKPHLNNIYGGLGIPPTLTSQFGDSGTTNNFISLKTLIERLTYGRRLLTKFWEKESRIIQQAMGFRFPAKVEYDIANLGEEVAEKSLLIQLADRNLISDELLQRRFGSDAEMEKIRLRKEQKDRAKGIRVPKSGPFHEPQFGLTLKRVALEKGYLTPSQVGLTDDSPIPDMKLNDDVDDINKLKRLNEPSKPPASSPNSKKGQPQQGRPKNSKDSNQRKKKDFKPKTKAVLEIWAKAAQMAIAESLNSEILRKFDKKNMRSLSKKESYQAEMIKFGVLLNLEPLGIVDDNTIANALNKEIPDKIESLSREWVQEISSTLQRDLTLDEIRDIHSAMYANIYGENNG